MDQAVDGRTRGKITDQEEFRARFEEFLTDELGFADTTKVSISSGELTIDVGGCAICHGNEMLRQAGEPAMCPILATGLTAISRVLGKNATLPGADEEGKPVGFFFEGEGCFFPKPFCAQRARGASICEPYGPSRARGASICEPYRASIRRPRSPIKRS